MPSIFLVILLCKATDSKTFDRTRVLFVAEVRKQSSLDGFWPTLSQEQRDGIEAVAMDMWDPYIREIRAIRGPITLSDQT